ncbi:Transposable element Tcb1 transposase, partial [Stegodyphus mimosarum]
MTQRTYLDDFLRGRIIGRLECGRTQLEVSDELGIAQSVISRLWQRFQDDGNVSRSYSTSRPRVTTPNEDRYLSVTAKRNRRSPASDLSRQLSSATGTTISKQTVYRRLGQIGLYARRPVRCVPLTATHCRLRLAWSRGHALWTPQQWACVMFSDESRRLLQCGLRARTPLYRIPLTHDHRRLRLQWANQHRDWRADWQHVVFSDESRFNLWYHDGRIRVRRYAGERHLPECIIERHSGRTPGVMVWGAIAYHRRSQLLRIVGNLNSNRYIREVLQPEAVPFLQSLPGAVFQQDNARPHTARIVKSFFAAQQVQLLPWPACSPDMSPIEHVWDVIGRRLARDPCPVASADELWVRVQTIWNALPQSDIQTLFDSMPRRVAALIAARGGHTKY